MISLDVDRCFFASIFILVCHLLLLFILFFILQYRHIHSGIMGKKKRQPDPNINSNSSESSAEDNSIIINGCSCSHVAKGVNFPNVKKALKTAKNIGSCCLCQKHAESSENKNIDSNTVWMCLQCGNQGCGRYSENQHALKHYDTPQSCSHALALCLENGCVCTHYVMKRKTCHLSDEALITMYFSKTRCYECDDEVLLETHKKLTECVDFIKKQSPKNNQNNSTKTEVNIDKETILKDNFALKESLKESLPKKDPVTEASKLSRNVRGLSNLGNTCFFNSVMQNISQTNCLSTIMNSHVKAGLELIIKPGAIKTPEKQPKLEPIKLILAEGGPITKCVEETVTEMQSFTKSGSVNPSTLFSHICRKFSIKSCSFHLKTKKGRDPVNVSLQSELLRFIVRSGKKLTFMGISRTKKNNVHDKVFGFLRREGFTSNQEIGALISIDLLAPQFKGFQQQDSHELLRHLLDGMRLEEVRRVKTAILSYFNVGKGTAENLEEDAKQKIKSYGRTGSQTIMEKVFGGSLISTVVCEECHMSSQVIESFLDLSLPVSEEKPLRPNLQKKVNDISPVSENDITTMSKYQDKKLKRQSKKEAKKKAKQEKYSRKSIDNLEKPLMENSSQENLKNEKLNTANSAMKKAHTNDKDRKLIINTEALFRRLLAVAQCRHVDMKKVLSYELSAVPPSLIHKDGSMKKTGKAELTKKLEANFADILVELPQISTIPESTSSAYIIDGYDSEIILHAISLSRDHSRVIVRCDDTDVLVLLIYYSSREQLAEKVYMYTGHSGKERYIPVHEIVTQLKPIVCECLPAVHAIGGCDTICSFNRIGKRTAYSTLIKNAHTLSDMKRFHEADMDTCISLARKFVLLMYGKKGKHMDSLNDLRFHFATTTDTPASMLPPTEDSFKQHILRAKYQTKIWCESHIANSPLISPVGHGWSSCELGGITQTKFTQDFAPVEFFPKNCKIRCQIRSHDGLFGALDGIKLDTDFGKNENFSPNHGHVKKGLIYQENLLVFPQKLQNKLPNSEVFRGHGGLFGTLDKIKLLSVFGAPKPVYRHQNWPGFGPEVGTSKLLLDDRSLISSLIAGVFILEISDADVEDNCDTSSVMDSAVQKTNEDDKNEDESTSSVEENEDKCTIEIDNLSSKVKGMRIRRKSQSADSLLAEDKENTEESFEVLDSSETNNIEQSTNDDETDRKEEWKARSLTSLAPRYQCSSHECSVQSCLNQFTAAELLTGSNKFGCENCSKLKAEKNKTDSKKETVYSIANKQLLLFSPPAVLTLHLKRFQQVGFNLKKINTHVTFPLLLDLAPFCSSICLGLPTLKNGQKNLMYSLYGIVEHSGRLTGGHYTAHVKVRENVKDFKNFLNVTPPGQYEIDCLIKEMATKSPANENVAPQNEEDISSSNGKWFYVSDSIVREVSVDSVLKAQAYILFYERVF
ncbi:Ubiquitin carboxyl-terminal hydrolase 45 [Nymphon striatum]|nr:Ubiquitin carboxyl-terminal hydrolase 45 [Nymphon striatum]